MIVKCIAVVFAPAPMIRSTAVPFVTAQRYVGKLEQLGILREVTGHSRNRRYRADAILQVIKRPMPTGEASGSA